MDSSPLVEDGGEWLHDGRTMSTDEWRLGRREGRFDMIPQLLWYSGDLVRGNKAGSAMHTLSSP